MASPTTCQGMRVWVASSRYVLLMQGGDAKANLGG